MMSQIKAYGNIYRTKQWFISKFLFLTDLGHFESSELVYKLTLQFPRIYSFTNWATLMKFDMRIHIIPYGPRLSIPYGSRYGPVATCPKPQDLEKRFEFLFSVAIATYLS